MSAIQQVRMCLCDGSIEVTIQRTGRMLHGEWHPSHETREFSTWGLAIDFVNRATCVQVRPDPTSPPSGVSDIDAEAMAEARAA